MLGPAKSRRLDEPIAVSLEDLVPPNNFYRHLEAKLDLGFVREWARDLYADRGRPSIDPVVFFKLQLILFFEGIRSERQLIEMASLNLAHRWYLGYALDEALPDHSSLTRIRQRLGVDVFQRFFEQVVDLCQEAGLVWGRELYVDATKVKANAAVDSLLPRFYHDAKAHVAGLFTDDPAAEDEHEGALEDAGIRAYVPLPDFNHRTAFFGRDAFAYNAEADVYRCPQGQSLRRRKIKYTEQEVLYRAEPATCNTCLVKAACTASDHGRIVHRSLYEEYLDKVRGYHATEAYQKAMRKRQVWVEPLFAEAKDWHGLRRLRLRGLMNANIQGLLIAAGQNLKRFLAATGWGRRNAPCGSLVALPRELWGLSAVSR